MQLGITVTTTKLNSPEKLKVMFLFQAEEEELDIDLGDPELNKAATKIQASFRGHKVRKEHEAPAHWTNTPWRLRDVTTRSPAPPPPPLPAASALWRHESQVAEWRHQHTDIPLTSRTHTRIHKSAPTSRNIIINSS